MTVPCAVFNSATYIQKYAYTSIIRSAKKNKKLYEMLIIE